MNTTRNSNPIKKKVKIPEVKHFYDADAAKKVKKLAKKALNSNLVKHARAAAKPAKNTKKKSTGSKGLLAGVIAAPMALEAGSIAVIAAGGYALWKNREKIQEFLGGIVKSEAKASDLN